MHERSHQVATTENNVAIRYPERQIEADDFRKMFEMHGVGGSNPRERVDSFRTLRVEDVAGLLDDINKGVLGSKETMLSGSTMKVGEQELVPVEARYDLFEQLVHKIQQAPEDIDPQRFGDSLALLTTMLHPFKDGNGRTARLVAYPFVTDEEDGRTWYDNPGELESDFTFYAGSRDEMRRQGKNFRPIGYVPNLPPGADLSRPDDVLAYFDELLSGSNRSTLYAGSYGQAQQKTTV